MKKLFVIALIFVGALSVSANDYTHSVGVVAGGMNGFSYKMFVTENLAFQADLGVGLTATKGISMIETFKHDGEKETMKEKDNKVTYSMWDFVINPNLMYQTAVGHGFSVFAGGGLSLGMGTQFAANYEGV